MADLLAYRPIGIIHSPFSDLADMPIQPTGAKGIPGRAVIDPAYREGLKDLEGFSYIHLVYAFHLSEGYNLHVKPFLDNRIRGVFSTRAPRRPNAIGLSVVRLVRVEENILHIEDVDMVDGTPLLDIKPYVPAFDVRSPEKTGWLENRAENAATLRSDRRFVPAANGES
ncbi:MAG TPA: tRNA (N6-threonylcarbamoyladenosine(37)-N6)-methyltransferase TrmO [Syntrophales bacterium]|jgi:tRNA-Thr(GGU) m(6)t(6)A37 methyltransferase TsaA|nr:tRNA (N6-threonylcarbamoyladenosine(37)-N6)-methyltransferase TrmO [Syntrophales bacterium]